MYMPFPLPRRLIATSLILIFVGLLPRIASLIGFSLPSPKPLLQVLVPPHVVQWLIDNVTFNGIAVVGLALLAIAAVLVVRKLWQQHYTSTPISTSGVLLQEVNAIHGKEADKTLQEASTGLCAAPAAEPRSGPA